MATNKIYIPTFISSVTYAPARVLPHVYFYNGKKASETYYIQGYSNGNTGSVVSNAIDAFPYFDNYEGQDPQSGSRSLLFFNEPAVYGTTPTNSLYNDYWETYVNLLYNPRTRLVNCEAIIPLADYFKMELNDICEWRGNYYHLRAINSYNLSNGECQLQLLGPLYPPVISGILPELQCNFDFTSSVFTTTTTTAAPTTTTTTVAPTTTTTLAPTTTTTTIQPYCICENVRFTNNHTRLFGVLDYTPCGTTEQIREYVNPRSTRTRCLANPPGFSYPAGTDFFYTILGTCTVPACAGITTSTTTLAPTTTTTTTAAPTTTTTTNPLGACFNFTFTGGVVEGGTATYYLCGQSTPTITVLGINQSITVCCHTGGKSLTGTGSTISQGSSCITSTTTTTTSTTTTTAAPTTTTTSTTTAGPSTTTTTISSSCTTYQITNPSAGFAGQVRYVPCGKSGYRDIFVPQSTTITLCVSSGQISNVSGYATSTITNLGTACTSSLTDCVSYTISNSAGVSRDYSGKACSNCATSLYNINAGQTVVRCFVSGTFSTSYPANVTAVAGANCNVSGSGCPS